MDVVGPAFAMEIFFTARQFSADEALAMGLVNRVVEDGELEGLVADYCDRVAENAPLTIGAVKTCVRELLRGRELDRERCEAVVRACFDSEDYVEGRRAFLEKRRPCSRAADAQRPASTSPESPVRRSSRSPARASPR